MTKKSASSRFERLHSSFVSCLSRRSLTKADPSSFRRAGFTIMELLIVITIIVVLAALVISTVGYVQKKAARSRAEAEIAAMSAACESYKADNGTYPTSADTYGLDARTAGDPSSFQKPSQYLFTQLSGMDINQTTVLGKSYMTFKPQMLGGTRDSNGNLTGGVLFLRDPFGNSYGYSTAGNPDALPAGGSATSGKGYNPTFDLWSTAGTTTNSAADQAQWIKNW